MPTTYSDAQMARARITAGCCPGCPGCPAIAFSVRCASHQPTTCSVGSTATATVLGLCALLRDAQRTGDDPRVRARGIGCRSCCAAPPVPVLTCCSRAAKCSPVRTSAPTWRASPAQFAPLCSAGAAAVVSRSSSLGPFGRRSTALASTSRTSRRTLRRSSWLGRVRFCGRTARQADRQWPIRLRLCFRIGSRRGATAAATCFGRNIIE